jgi:glycosyltransferase involved in cell wall biosynthesis
MPDKLFIVMPAYNEEANIESVVEQWHPVAKKISNGSTLMIINDGSRDSTFLKLTDLAKRYPCLIPVDKPNSGHGSTCLFGYRESIRSGADYIFQTDSDGQTDPGEFWKFWDKRNEYDFIVGSRNSRQDGFGRKVVSGVLRLVVWSIFGTRVKDPNTPFRLMKSKRLEKILKTIPDDFFLSNVIISTIAVKWHERCLWIPITFKPRQGGKNSINFRRIFKIGWKAIGDFRSIKKSL